MTEEGPAAPYKKLAPGVYLDSRGDGVVVVSEILQLFLIPDTPQNRLEVLEMVKQLEPDYSKMEFVYRLPGDPTWRK